MRQATHTSQRCISRSPGTFLVADLEAKRCCSVSSTLPSMSLRFHERQKSYEVHETSIMIFESLTYRPLARPAGLYIGTTP